MTVTIHPSRFPYLKTEFEKEYFSTIKKELVQKKAEGERVFPPGSLIFNAFNATPFDLVKVVVLGQDPYHGPGQAHGLSFSVQKGVRIPPSLKNIYKEMLDDVGGKSGAMPDSGDLTYLAAQGVFLLNSILTVAEGQPASHSKLGRERFTDHVLKTLSDHKEGVVFILWGAFARSKKKFIDQTKHTVLEAPHPSPLSSYRGFFGSQPFSKTNSILESQGQTSINRLDSTGDST